MELKIGTTIKKLRVERGITQETLANKMGVSFQAVSKWETNTTTPDISIIPKLSLYFGVSIDTLFSMNRDDYMIRISNMIRDEQSIDCDNFLWAERYLKGVIYEENQNIEARILLVELYEHRENRDTLNVGAICEECLLIAPSNIALHGKLLRVRQKRSEEDRLLKFYELLSGKFPENDIVTEMLIKSYLMLGNLEQARHLISVSAPKPIYELFIGDIEMSLGNVELAYEIWTAAAEKYLINHDILFEAAERFNKYGYIEKAISLYEQSYNNASEPKPLDSLYSRAFLYTKLGNNNDAVSMWNKIIYSLEHDYGVCEGECVDWARREITKL